MKRPHRIEAFAVAALLVVAGCRDILVERPQSFTTTDTFYKTAADLNTAALATYAAFSGYEARDVWCELDLASDLARAEHREPNYKTRSPDYLDFSPSNGKSDDFWDTGYAVITLANLLLEHAPGIQAKDTLLMQYNVGEAKLMRAFAYVDMAKAYGDVPLLLSVADQARLDVTRTPVEQVEQAAIKDMTDAEALLPTVWSSTDGFGNPTQGRLTKGAAQMALADIYLWRSSFHQKNEWQLAATWAKKVIDSGAWRLSDDYFSTFLPSNKGNREMIWVITNAGVSENSSSQFQLFYYPRDWGANAGQGGGWGLMHPTDWFLASYASGDYRASTCATRDSTHCGYITGGCSASGQCVSPFGDGPMPWKYQNSDGGIDYRLMNVDVPLYRYSEAYLMYAEAENELGNAAEATNALNVIRARARKGTGAENRSSPADYNGSPDKLSLREAIFMERAWELAFEAKRWWDLIRRDGEEPGYWQKQLLTHDAADVLLISPLTPNKMRFPIPSYAISANPRLTQNPGY